MEIILRWEMFLTDITLGDTTLRDIVCTLETFTSTGYITSTLHLRLLLLRLEILLGDITCRYYFTRNSFGDVNLLGNVILRYYFA